MFVSIGAINAVLAAAGVVVVRIRAVQGFAFSEGADELVLLKQNASLKFAFALVVASSVVHAVVEDIVVGISTAADASCLGAN